MKYIIVLLLVCNVAFAQSLNLALPNTPGSYLSDRIRAGDIECNMGIGSGTTVEFGVIGVINAGNQTIVSNNLTNANKDVGVYGRITIPIGAPKTRLECDSLYQIELRRKNMEIERMEIELRNLRNLKFENASK